MHSGTTMLIKILKKHSHIYAVDTELRLFESYPGFDHKHDGKKKHVVTALNKLPLTDEERVFIDSQVGDILGKTDTIGEMMIGIIEQLMRKKHKLIWAEKTPSNIFFVDEIVKRFPDCKIVLIYRDIRSIIASKKLRTMALDTGRYSEDKLMKKRLEKDWNVIADSFSWRGAVKAQLAAKKRHPEKVFVVNYEEFVRDPVLGWERICAFLRLPFERECLDIGFRNSALKDVAASEGVVASRTSWQDVLTSAEAKLASALNAQALRAVGYSASVSRNIPGLFVSFCIELPGVLRRFVKRYRLFSLGYFYVYCRSLLRRI